MIKLYLKKSDYNTILTHCTAGLPNESCGLLAGTEEDEEITVTKVYLLTNVDASREHFSMDPKEQLAALKDARANGYKIIGNFHSHPESPSRPKKTNAWHLTRPLNTLSSPLWKKEIRYSKHSESTKKKMSRSTRSRSQNKVRKKKP